MATVQIDIPHEKLARFCRRWKIAELALFGSVLRDDFSTDSDVDVLVVFESGAHWSLLDVIQAEQELSELLGRPADLVEKPVIEQSENWIRRREILATARVIYGRRESDGA
jgi:uncharacterized protein